METRPPQPIDQDTVTPVRPGPKNFSPAPDTDLPNPFAAGAMLLGLMSLVATVVLAAMGKQRIAFTALLIVLAMFLAAVGATMGLAGLVRRHVDRRGAAVGFALNAAALLVGAWRLWSVAQ